MIFTIVSFILEKYPTQMDTKTTRKDNKIVDSSHLTKSIIFFIVQNILYKLSGTRDIPMWHISSKLDRCGQR